jgi:hypothetical protein
MDQLLFPRSPNRPLALHAHQPRKAIFLAITQAPDTTGAGRCQSVYELPLAPGKGGLVAAKKIGQTDLSPPPGGFPHPFGAQPTGLDLSPDGSMAAVVTRISEHRA